MPLLTSLLCATTIFAAAPTASPLAPTSGALPRAPTKKIVPAAKNLRLRAKLIMQATTDLFEGGGMNTEDEIYYKLGGIKVIDKQVSVVSKTLRPTGAKDVWEMGPQTNKTLQRVIFAGKLGWADSLALSLVIAEQDNAELKTFTEIANLIAQTLGTMVTPGLDLAQLSNPVKQDALYKLTTQVEGVLSAIGSEKDQVPGVIGISLTKQKLAVTAPTGSQAKILAQSSTHAKIELTGDKSKYILELVLEDASNPPPKNREFLDYSEDNCSHALVKIPSVDGVVTVKKGERKDVYIPNKAYAWYCGETKEAASAPAGTNLADTKRLATGAEIQWRWYREATPSPDLVP